jgi:hypothetical protein
MNGMDSVFVALLASLAVMLLVTWVRVEWFN